MNRAQLGNPAGPGRPTGLILDYQPSQITGWGGFTLGGHVADYDFTYQETAYTVSLVPFGQPGDSPDPIYENVPADPAINFRPTLAQAWGAYYSFRYLSGRGAFSVQSYNVTAPTSTPSAVGFGGELYLVYQPDRARQPAIDDELRFIQVVCSNSGGAGSALASVVDNNGRANPFYGEGGGLISVNGNVSVSFYDRPGHGMGRGKGPVSLAPWSFMAEVFLAHDTGVKDAAGKGIVNIFGGVKWGWQVRLTSPAPSRRSVLRGGAAAGLSAMAAPLLRAPAGSGPRTGSPAEDRGGRRHLVPGYRSSQQTGWGQEYTPTIGGHTASADFTFRGTGYRVSLLPSGQPGDSPDPVYEAIPADPTVSFRETLAAAWGSYYSFRYQGGFRGHDELTVTSYSAFADESSPDSPGLSYGADLYLTYTPHAGDPPVRGLMYWIQVINWPGGTGSPGSAVDNGGHANPFYGPAGGLTSINGNQVFSFYDISQDDAITGQAATVPDQFTAEVFLAQDTGVKDTAGKDIVNIFGGVKWGWQATTAP
jgi:hypothetical protein